MSFGLANKNIGIKENTLITANTEWAEININNGGTVQNVAYSASATDLTTGTLNAARLPTQTTQEFNILGHITGTAQTIGNVGQVIEAITPVAITMPNNITTTIISLNLTPGCWMVLSNFSWTSNAVINNLQVGLGLTAGTLGANTLNTQYVQSTPNFTQLSLPCPVQFFNVSVNTTVFLMARGTFTIATWRIFGRIEAVRIF